MNSLSIFFNYEYVSSKVDITWEDIKFGIDQGFLSTDAAIKHATKLAAENPNFSSVVFELASLYLEDSIQPYFDQVVKSESITENEEIAAEKWLYLTLNWLYENKEEFPDPLALVEEVYADFNYPESISKFVRYMPLEEGEEPLSPNKEMAVANIYKNWLNYLVHQANRFVKKNKS